MTTRAGLTTKAGVSPARAAEALATGALAIRTLAFPEVRIRHARIARLDVDELATGKITRPKA